MVKHLAGMAGQTPVGRGGQTPVGTSGQTPVGIAGQTPIGRGGQTPVGRGRQTPVGTGLDYIHGHVPPHYFQPTLNSSVDTSHLNGSILKTAWL